MTLQRKVLVFGVGGITIIVLILGVIMTIRQKDLHEWDINQKAELLVSTLATPCIGAISSGRLDEIDRTIEEFIERREEGSDVESIEVLDHRFRIVGHTHKELYGQFRRDEIVRKAALGRDMVTREVVTAQGRHLVVAMPLVTAIGDSPGIRWGTVVATLSLGRTDSELLVSIIISLSMIVFVGLFAVGLKFVLMRVFVFGPLKSLASAARSIQAGDLSSRVAVQSDADELSEVAQAFNSMAEALQQRTSQLDMKVKEGSETIESTNQRLMDALQRLEMANRRLETANTQLQELATTDPLTGLYNRRRLEEMLEVHTALCVRSKRRLSLLMVDVDYFKTYNDTFGHLAGDNVLRQVGELLRSRLRKTDVACRFGGDEFAVMLPDTAASEAAVLAENLRILVASHDFQDAAGQDGNRMTISVGVAAFGPGVDNPSAILDAADKALYEAKARGRNQSVLLS